ncbi:hypothetical protein AMK26_16105 [Streptomyces sp. CB03234]|nr:hypothetical protein AMK26_16105 [Streptomyces sp. CB03234]
MRRRWWSAWPRWSAVLAVAWSALYGLAALYWSLGGDGFPFAKVHNDRASASLLEPSPAPVVAPLIAVFCAAGVAAGIRMLRAPDSTRHRKLLLGYGWTAAVGLGLLIPDYSILGLLVFSPALLVFVFTGVPGPQDLGDILYWHRINIIIVFIGGVLWLGATLAHQRRTARQCVRCGRSGKAAAAWTRPEAALRWGRWAVWGAVAATIPYDITRIAWYFGRPLGITDGFLKEMQDTPGMLEMGLALGLASTLGSLLTHGLISRWGEIWPRWVWFKKGGVIHPATALVPAGVMAAVIVPGGLMSIRHFETAEWGALGPSILWVFWGVGLGIAAFSYYLRRRGECAYCHRGA